jgi:hypothetical protein
MAWDARRDGVCTPQVRQGSDGNLFAVLRSWIEVYILQADGTAPMSFTSNLLEGSEMSAEEDHAVKWSALSLYGGGSDTVSLPTTSSENPNSLPQTVSAIYSLFLAMTLFPDVQKKAQAEIDAVVGPDRLPSFADRDSLPYTEALVTEVLRWNVVFPTGMRVSFMTFCIFQRVSQ